MLLKLTAKKLTVLSVSTALQIVILLLTLVLPTVKLSMLFLASLLNGLLCSAGYKKRHVFMSFISVSILSMLLISNYIIPASYILFFGGYGIVHFASKPKKQFVKQLIRFAYLAIGSAALYLLFSSFFKGTLLLKVPYIYFLPAVAAVGYILFQLLYDMVIKEFFKNNYLSSLISDNNTSGI